MNYNINTIIHKINNKNIIKFKKLTNITHDYILNTKKIHKENIYNTNFVNSNTYKDTLKYLNNYKIFKISINKSDIYVYIFHHDDYNYYELIKKIYKYLQLFYKTFEDFIVKSNKNILKLYIYTLPYKNVFNKHILNTNDINSGYTQFKPEDKVKIVIYKLHKLTKVLIHELIHFFNIDTNILPVKLYNDIDNFIQNNIKTNYPILTFEGITEFLAIYLNTIYKNKGLNINQIKIKLEEQINIYTKYMNIIFSCNFK